MNMERINLIPFKTIISDLVTVAAPVTIIDFRGTITVNTISVRYLSLGIIVNKIWVVLTIFLTTIFIETYQLLDNFIVSGYVYSEGGSRAIDIDEILLNTMAGLIGIVLFIIYKKLFLQNPFIKN